MKEWLLSDLSQVTGVLGPRWLILVSRFNEDVTFFMQITVFKFQHLIDKIQYLITMIFTEGPVENSAVHNCWRFSVHHPMCYCLIFFAKLLFALCWLDRSGSFQGIASTWEILKQFLELLLKRILMHEDSGVLGTLKTW